MQLSQLLLGGKTLGQSRDEYRVHNALWESLEGVNQVSLSTFVHLLHLDSASKLYHTALSLALTLRSNLLPADLRCLSNPARCPKPITHIQISY